MNFAERLCGLYLRFNGFFLMPAFSTFTIRAREEDPRAHAHVDILGFRPAGTLEEFEAVRFPVDACLFECLSAFVEKPLLCPIAVVCEVRTNRQGEFPRLERRRYAKSICGGIDPVPMCFDTSVTDIAFDQQHEGIHVGLAHAHRWVTARIRWLEDRDVPKLASWNWSEPTLAEMLVLQRLQFADDDREAAMLVLQDEAV